jgi:hypothetical protein
VTATGRRSPSVFRHGQTREPRRVATRIVISAAQPWRSGNACSLTSPSGAAVTRGARRNSFVWLTREVVDADPGTPLTEHERVRVVGQNFELLGSLRVSGASHASNMLRKQIFDEEPVA